MVEKEIDYNKLADEIPAGWCTEEDILDISNTILENLKSTMNTNVDEAAKLVNCTPEDIMETLKKAANIYGRMVLFEEKFGEIVDQFPRGSDGEINYPDKILAKIFDVSIEEAIELFHNHFGLGTEKKLSEIIIK